MKFSVAALLTAVVSTVCAQTVANAGVAVNLPSVGVSTKISNQCVYRSFFDICIASSHCRYYFQNHLVKI